MADWHEAAGELPEEFALVVVGGPGAAPAVCLDSLTVRCQNVETARGGLESGTGASRTAGPWRLHEGY